MPETTSSKFPPRQRRHPCEGGRASNTATDEPDGFAPILFMRGLGAGVAPLWRVDDRSSYLFITSPLGKTDFPTAAQHATIGFAISLMNQALSCVERTSDHSAKSQKRFHLTSRPTSKRPLQRHEAGCRARPTTRVRIATRLGCISAPEQARAYLGYADEVRTASDEPHRFATEEGRQ
jgi:hypothetical protein